MHLMLQEEELRKEGGKYAHLNEELHLLVECFAETVDGYGRLSNAITKLKEFMNPVSWKLILRWSYLKCKHFDFTLFTKLHLKQFLIVVLVHIKS